MLFNELFDKYTLDSEKAIKYGFEYLNGVYYYHKVLNNSDFYAVFEITEKAFQANVFELPDNDIYLPFNIKSFSGGFVSSIHKNVEEIIKDILQNCFILSDIKSVLLEYVNKKYKTTPEAPWSYLKEYHTLKTNKKQKWYGIFMFIPYKYLGVEKEGKINVLNVKVKPENIPQLIDMNHFFPAYHMNKKYWISILLDKNIDINHIEQLLDDSYAIIETK